MWGRSSAGRASRSQCEGREFDPPRLHQNEGNSNAALGAQFFVNKVVALRVEARDLDFYTLVGGKNNMFLDTGVIFLLEVC